MKWLDTDLRDAREQYVREFFCADVLTIAYANGGKSFDSLPFRLVDNCILGAQSLFSDNYEMAQMECKEAAAAVVSKFVGSFAGAVLRSAVQQQPRILQLLDMYDVDGRIEAEYILSALGFVSETYEAKLLRAVCQVEPGRVFSLRSLQKSKGCFIA